MGVNEHRRRTGITREKEEARKKLPKKLHTEEVIKTPIKYLQMRKKPFNKKITIKCQNIYLYNKMKLHYF